MIARRRTLRHGTFGGRHDQMAIATVQHEDVAGLGRGIQRGNDLALFVADIDQTGLSRNVHVPQVMMDGLVAPYQLAGGRVQRHDRTGIAFGIRAAVAAPDIGRLHAHRDVDQVQIGVIGRRDPRIGGIGHEGMVFGRHFVRVRIAGVERPFQRAGMHVEPTRHTRGFMRGIVVGHRTGHDYGGIGHDRGRCRFVKAQRLDGHAVLQVHHAIIAERCAAGAGFGIQREQLSVIGGQEDAARAFHRCCIPISRLRLGPVLMIGHTTACQVLEGGVVRQFWIELPPLPARFGIEREQDLVGRAQIQRITDLDGRDFIGDFTGVIGTTQVACAECPRDFQLADIIGIDLPERGKTVPELRAAIGLPVTIGHLVGVTGFGGVLRHRGQVARDILRVPHQGEADHDHGRANRAQQRHARAHARRLQVSRHPWQRQHDPDGDKDIPTWCKRPEVKPGFIDGPRHRAKQQDRVNRKRGCLSPEQQERRHQKQDTRDNIVERPSDKAQPQAAAQQVKTCQATDGYGCRQEGSRAYKAIHKFS